MKSLWDHPLQFHATAYNIWMRITHCFGVAGAFKKWLKLDIWNVFDISPFFSKIVSDFGQVFFLDCKLWLIFYRRAVYKLLVFGGAKGFAPKFYGKSRRKWCVVYHVVRKLLLRWKNKDFDCCIGFDCCLITKLHFAWPATSHQHTFQCV